jgi:AmmeMemoRadiSam system protein B
MAKVRSPVSAGYFYPARASELLEALNTCFLHKLGPGKLPEKTPRGYSGSLIGVVAPHAGYVYSGHIAAYSYLALSEGGRPDVVFILGPNHHALGVPIAIDENEAWETPLGQVLLDVSTAKELASRERIILFDYQAHAYEHSIEVQLPFLQFTFHETPRIVPVSMMLQTPEAAVRVGKAIASVITHKKLKAYVIASSDMSHYVESRIAREKDFKAIDKILALDIEGLYDTIIEEDISMCGPGPVMVLMQVARELGYTKAKLLKYADSGDVTGDKSSVVAYASISFEK